jgi:hypothetical protein
MNMEELKEYAWLKAIAHPALRTEIADLVELALSEIEAGGSEQHECDLAYHDIEELIKEAQRANR